MVELNFDASKVEPNSGGFEVLPEDWYDVIVIASDVKKTKSGDGEYLGLGFEVINGKHKGARLTDILNLWNKSDKARAIAEGTLSAICHAVGIKLLRNSGELHNRPLRARVEIEKRPKDDKPGEFWTSNKVRQYEAAGGSSSSSSAPSSSGSQPASNGDQSKPPWMRKAG